MCGELCVCNWWRCRVTSELASWVEGAGKIHADGGSCIEASVGADSDACVGEMAVTAGVLGVGKSISSYTSGGSDSLIVGLAEATGCLTVCSLDCECGSSCNCVSGPAH